MPVPSSAPGQHLPPDLSTRILCFLNLSAKDLLLPTDCLKPRPNTQHGLCSPTGTFLSESKPQTSEYQKAVSVGCERPQGKICAFAAFLVPGIKYLMRAAGGREGDSRVRSHGVEGVAAGHVASAVRQQRPMDAGDQLAFSFFFSLKQKPLG